MPHDLKTMPPKIFQDLCFSLSRARYLSHNISFTHTMISAFVTFGFLSSLSSLGLLWQQRRDRKQRQGQLLFFFLVLTLVLLVDPFLYIQHVHGFLNVPIVLKHALRNPRGGRGGVELHKNNHNSRHSTPCVFRTNSDGCGDSSLSVSGRPSRLWLRQRHGLVAKTTSSLFQMKKTDDTHVAVLLDQSSSPSNLPPMMQHSSLIGGLGGQVLTLLVVAYKFMTRPLYYFWHQFLSLTNGQKLLLGAVFGIGFAFGRVRPFWKRYIQVADIPSSMFGPYAPVLVGRAVSVTDGDTIRFLHRPTPFHPTSLSPGQKKSEFALPIRLCSIDTPGTLFYFVWGNTPRRTQWEKLHILEKYTPSGGSHRFTEAEYTCPHPPPPPPPPAPTHLLPLSLSLSLCRISSFAILSLLHIFHFWSYFFVS